MDTAPPPKPSLEDIDTEEMVGIDVGILKHAHDTDCTAVESLDLSEERDRLEQYQRKLSRKEYESNSWKNQRRRVAECHLQIKRKRRDFLHKLSNYYAREYELVAVKDIDVKGMMESPRNSRNTASAAWSTSPIYSKRRVTAKVRTSWKLNPKEPPKSTLSVASKLTSRCGCVNTPVRPVVSRRTETQMRSSDYV